MTTAEAMAAFPVKVDYNSGWTNGSPCWLWLGRRNQRDYGVSGRRGAYRVVYEAVKGPIPGGLVLDHLCRVKPCVNPGHLEPVTNAENLRRGADIYRMLERNYLVANGHRRKRRNITARARRDSLLKLLMIDIGPEEMKPGQSFSDWWKEQTSMERLKRYGDS